MSLDADPRIAARLATIERQLARLMREPRHRDKRDGRAVLAVRVGDELASLVRLAAPRQGRTISDLLRPAIIAAVNQPSTQRSELHSPAFMPRTLPREAARQALSSSLGEQARLAAAGAAVMADRRPRDARGANSSGMLTDAVAFGSLSLRRR
jgi:hypothetical protein